VLLPLLKVAITSDGLMVYIGHQAPIESRYK